MLEELEVQEVDLEYIEKTPSVGKILKEAKYWADLSSPDRNSNMGFDNYKKKKLEKV